MYGACECCCQYKRCLNIASCKEARPLPGTLSSLAVVLAALVLLLSLMSVVTVVMDMKAGMIYDVILVMVLLQ